MEKINEEQIKEINKHISDALEDWANIMIASDADEWSCFLDYSDEDVLNALYIFNHVAASVAIKNGYFQDEEDAVDKMNLFRKYIYKTYGFDTKLLIDKVYGKRDLREKPS